MVLQYYILLYYVIRRHVCYTVTGKNNNVPLDYLNVHSVHTIEFAGLRFRPIIMFCIQRFVPNLSRFLTTIPYRLL